jgi:ABC-2 type transport system permease protein
MNSQSTAMRESSSDSQVNESRGIASAVPIQRFYWSVRRELWENHSIYITPLAVAAVAVLGYLILALGVPVPMPDPRLLDEPYSMAAAFVVGIFYSLETLHGERRDRSILFWKSLPVSDLTTVLSKASIPLLVLPLFSFAIAAATEVIEMGLTSVVRPAGGLSVATPSTSVFRISLVLLLYHTVTVNVLWHAPIYTWLLLVSGWARRDIFVGRLALDRDLRRHAGRPLRGRPGGCQVNRQIRRCLIATYSRTIPEQPGSVDRAGSCRGVSYRSGPATPISRSDLIRMQLVSTRA